MCNDPKHPKGCSHDDLCLQGTPGSSRGTSKPWAPPAVIDDNSSAFVRYAVSHRAFAGSGPPSRQSSATLSSQVRAFLEDVLCLCSPLNTSLHAVGIMLWKLRLTGPAHVHREMALGSSLLPSACWRANA